MRKIAFGTGSLDRPTPRIVGIFVNAWSGIGSGLIGLVNASDWIPDKAGHILTFLLAATIVIAQGIRPYFGVKTDERKIPIGEVKELGEDPKSIS